MKGLKKACEGITEDLQSGKQGLFKKDNDCLFTLRCTDHYTFLADMCVMRPQRMRDLEVQLCMTHGDRDKPSRTGWMGFRYKINAEDKGFLPWMLHKQKLQWNRCHNGFGLPENEERMILAVNDLLEEEEMVKALSSFMSLGLIDK